MALDTIDTLLAVLRRTQLLAPEQVDEVARELAPHYRDPLSLGEQLVSIDWLTSYQFQLLMAGNWNELTVGPYHVLDRLGEGGVGEVFKAWDTLRGRIVALKVLRQHLAVRADAVKQLQREFQAITRLSHPNVIKTHDAGHTRDVHYFAMECVEGMDLERYVKQVGPLSVESACDYIRQAAQGLQHAHQLQLVHRDIKPANLFLIHPPIGENERRPDPLVKILDWGLARCLGKVAAAEGNGRHEYDSLEQHERCALTGTADYIAPEQAEDSTLVDIRADIYSLGCTLYYLLAGAPPFPAPSLMQKIMRHKEAAPPSLRDVRDDVPEELDALVQKMLAKNPADRFQIPLLIVTPLRRFCSSLVPSGSRNGAGSSGVLKRPGSSLNLPRPTPAPGTAINLPRPATQPSLQRPNPK